MILAIETSCDETACSIVKRVGDHKFKILSNIIASQINIHQKYGGVVPEVASRQHTEKIDSVVKEAIEQANIKLEEVEAVAATFAPGLIGALLVGFNFAKALAYGLGVPFIPVHHIEGHIAANYIENDMPPDFLCLVVSGGHSHIIKVENYDNFEVLARTRDDAAGEAFDKIARLLGLGYPGGPAIEKAAQNGNPHAYKFPQVKFENSDDFSFSGVKTSVINLVHNMQQRKKTNNEEVITNNYCRIASQFAKYKKYKKERIRKNSNHSYSLFVIRYSLEADISASFQHTICSTLTDRLICVAEKSNTKTIAISGGVACNGYLKNMLKEKAVQNGLDFYYPAPILCIDNAAMIATRAFYHFDKKQFGELDSNAKATLPMG
ncbi:MAG: tRNA (adenosine(37)-N6)-threonylcarbamoyltransferase complex transferase subunit TsaD [Oscillospiraceae bacterium]|nr:tRNA (adenosine(37)-N6)-threonylcarbamoyltransferase complex transferase subunit TsaD [Oscillospiraceae bacterium]